MSQEIILAIIAAFGPISTADLKMMRFGRQSVADALKVLHHTGEIQKVPRRGGRLSSMWVAR